MKWKVIRLELASNGEFPRGSAGRTYLVRLPLSEDGAICAATLEAESARATVRRYWPNEADRMGQLVRTRTGFAIRYEADGRESRLFRFDAKAIRPGAKVVLTELDGRDLPFRVAACSNQPGNS